MNNLDSIRQEIDSIDEKLLILLAKRFSLAKQVGKYKKIHNLPIIDKKREQEVIRLLSKKNKNGNLPENVIKKLWSVIFLESWKIEK